MNNACIARLKRARWRIWGSSRLGLFGWCEGSQLEACASGFESQTARQLWFTSDSFRFDSTRRVNLMRQSAWDLRFVEGSLTKLYLTPVVFRSKYVGHKQPHSVIIGERLVHVSQAF